MGVKIRKAGISDAEEIRKLYLELREFEMSLLDDELREIQLNWEKKKTIKDVKELLISEEKALFLAIDGDETIGFVTGGFQKGMKYKEGGLDIFVKGSHRGQGTGTKLMETILEWFAEMGCVAFYVNIYSPNAMARKFYEKFGMRQVGETYKKRI